MHQLDTSALEAHLPSNLAEHPDCLAKAVLLFQLPQAKQPSAKHLALLIVTNPMQIFNLLHSHFLAEHPHDTVYYQLKQEMYGFVKWLIEQFPLNAKFLAEEAYVLCEKGKLTFAKYLIEDIKQAYKAQLLPQSTLPKDLLVRFRQAVTAVFFSTCEVSTLRHSELQLITQSLADLYYERQLSLGLIETCFRLVEAGLQHREIAPFLYFIGKDAGVKVLFQSSKWMFRKGMTLFLWFTCLAQCDCQLLSLRTDRRQELSVLLRGGQLAVQVRDGDAETEVLEVCDLPLLTRCFLAVEIEPEGLFKTQSLNINLNGHLYENIPLALPKFETAQFITEYTLFSHFIGKVHSILLCAREEMQAYGALSKVSHHGPCREELVWEVIQQQIVRTETIVCFFNSERVFEGVLLNYVASKNHACFEGKLSKAKSRKENEVEVFLPFLHLLSVLPQRDSPEYIQLCDLIFKHIIKTISEETPQHSTLFLLYFMELTDYAISAYTLQFLRECTDHYLSVVEKYIDAPRLIQKGLMEKLVEEVNPVDKTQLMLYLQTEWGREWGTYQQNWWAPSFYEPQIDTPYDSRRYDYSPKPHKVEWAIREFIGNDYCKCLLQPQFPPLQASRFQNEYVKKGCNSQEFLLNLTYTSLPPFITVEKVSRSPLRSLKRLIFSKQDHQVETRETKNIQQFSTECLFINTLTVVIGVLSITKDGYLVFAGRHNHTKYDHMCIKAFKNEELIHVKVHYRDVRFILKKRFNASANAISIRTKDARDIFIYFNLKNMENFVRLVEGFIPIRQGFLESSNSALWIQRSLSNYEYLQWLNEIAGRNYSDITQYPVLPWTYVAEDETKIFRDLTKNMGSLGNAQRIEYFMQKYESNNEEQLFNEYHFGTHYSASAIIFNFLIRLRPYSIGALTLQSGKYDCADRIFYSYGGSWRNATTSPTDIRELVPELYTLPEMFLNKNQSDFGLTQLKTAIDNVELPKWAKNNPYHFVVTLRTQLESDEVSAQLHNWIDLIYGYKQRGKPAIQAMNIYYPLTYQNSIDLDKVSCQDERVSFETQIAHFGQNPAQIIGNNPHPARRKAGPCKRFPDLGQVLIQKCMLGKAGGKEEQGLFGSVFEGRNAVLGVKFVSRETFFVVRKHQYYLFDLSLAGDFLSKEHEISYELESCWMTLNYKQLATHLPIAALSPSLLLLGGFYNGYTHLLFIEDHQFSRPVKFPLSTITSLGWSPLDSLLYLGDSEGTLAIYRLETSARSVQFEQLCIFRAHEAKINCISVSIKANLIATCSNDGLVRLYNAYTNRSERTALLKTFRHPMGLPVNYCQIVTCPLYSVAFFSREDTAMYSYSINGQFLDCVIEKTGFIYGMSLIPSADNTECLVYLNSDRQIYIDETPFLRLKRKIKLKKDESKITCFECGAEGRVAIAGTEDGSLHVISSAESN